MAVLSFENQEMTLQEGETVLDGLLRHGFEIPNGCRSGACQSCVLQVHTGTVPATAQNGLKSAQKQLGYFLSCSCIPSENIGIARGAQVGSKVQAQVTSIESVNSDVLRLRLQTHLDFRAGQYVNIWLGNRTVRSYSIASLPEEGVIELHVRIIPGGAFSAWAKDHLTVGDTLEVQGPLGQCFYTEDMVDQDLLLAGIGTGLAPLYGIVKDALHHNHRGQIYLLVGARHSADFYLRDELNALAHQHPQLQVQHVAQEISDPAGDLVQADIYAHVKTRFPSTKDMSVFLCGAESFVRKMKKQCFLAGAAMKSIHADVFLPCS